ncbi:sensor histidine kinase [Aquimarina litoralis]|uniref:sensor histidine kinase n=1 Tax=Aquimarina litoralis TaxID=584605 RepID=UPI001C584314|nr:histidine kinase [Aquimarina litoralis]MBW1298567.1 GHKL domain-containing protein [Aquimarina litoralis]
MSKYFRKYFYTIIIGTLILVSIIGMIRFKRLEELSGLEIHDHYFYLFQFIFLILVGCLVIKWLFSLWKQYQTLKNDKNEAELMLLKSKIDPHFFFNTLNNLYGLAIEKSDKTPEVILKLSQIMRYTIYEGEQQTVTLKKEIEHLEQYIEIHQLRYKKEVHISFEKFIDNDQIKIAPLLFIMLLENAIKHGVESMISKAYIKISLSVRKNKVHFEIENNFKSKSKDKEGIGLKNLRKRLQLLYYRKHELILNSNDDVFKAILKITV